jgi:hypothetical protein
MANYAQLEMILINPVKFHSNPLQRFCKRSADKIFLFIRDNTYRSCEVSLKSTKRFWRCSDKIFYLTALMTILCSKADLVGDMHN